MSVARTLRLCLRLKPQDGETADDYAYRLADAAHKLPEERWQSLGVETQDWVNKFLQAKDEDAELPELPGNPLLNAQATGKRTPKEPKPAKAKKNRGRTGQFALTDKITIVKEKPYRPGTVRARMFEKYRDGMTVAEALDAGIDRVSLRWSSFYGHVKIG